jgi:hypothetical protein
MPQNRRQRGDARPIQAIVRRSGVRDIGADPDPDTGKPQANQPAPGCGSGAAPVTLMTPKSKECAMHLDISHLTEELTGVDERMHCVAVVLSLREGMSEVAEEFLAEGPPFDPAELGLRAHRAFLTDEEVVFVFEIEAGAAPERIFSEPDFWSVLPSWEHLIAGQPRVGRVIYEWPERHEVATTPAT